MSSKQQQTKGAAATTKNGNQTYFPIKYSDRILINVNYYIVCNSTTVVDTADPTVDDDNKSDSEYEYEYEEIEVEVDEDYEEEQFDETGSKVMISEGQLRFTMTFISCSDGIILMK